MTNLPILIIGAGGHAKVLLDTLNLSGRHSVLGLLDHDPKKHGTTVLGTPVLGDDRVLEIHPPDSVLLVNGIGSVGLPTVRMGIFQELKDKGYSFANVIHPSAVISPTARIGEGSQILAGAVIQAEASIGDNVIVNTRASIDHDCAIGNHVHIAPGVTLSGGTKVGSCSHIGTSASVIQGISIGERVIVAAGACVIREIQAGQKYFGFGESR